MFKLENLTCVQIFGPKAGDSVFLVPQLQLLADRFPCNIMSSCKIKGLLSQMCMDIPYKMH